jgi:hypothetical protein
MTSSNDASPPRSDSPRPASSRSDDPSGSPDLTPWSRPVLEHYGTIEDLTRGPGSGNIDALLGGDTGGFLPEEPTFS